MTQPSACGGTSALDAEGRLLIAQSSICAGHCCFDAASPPRMDWSFHPTSG